MHIFTGKNIVTHFKLKQFFLKKYTSKFWKNTLQLQNCWYSTDVKTFYRQKKTRLINRIIFIINTCLHMILCIYIPVMGLSLSLCTYQWQSWSRFQEQFLSYYQKDKLDWIGEKILLQCHPYTKHSRFSDCAKQEISIPDGQKNVFEPSLYSTILHELLL